MPEALDLLRSRISPKAQDLKDPPPTEDQLNQMLEIAVRVPDHGMMKPWRFIVHPKATRAKLVDALVDKFRAGNPSAAEAEIEKQRLRFGDSPLIVTVVSRTASNPKVPEMEQLLSAGAVCMNFLHAANAMGFAANWLTGWAAFDDNCRELFGLQPNERIAGFVHIGSLAAKPNDRPRPVISDLITRI